MRVIIDERETDLFEKCETFISAYDTSTLVRVSKEVLPLGDVYVKTDDDKDVCIIERKTIRDLLASIKDGRYEEQSMRLLHASELSPHNVIYIIEGMCNQIPTVKDKKTMYSAITSLNYYKGFTVFRTTCLQETAELVVWMCDKIEKNTLKRIPPSYLCFKAFRPSAATTRSTIDLPPPNPAASPEIAGGTTNSAVEVDARQGTGSAEAEPETEQTLGIGSASGPEPYCSVVKKVKKENITPENIGEIMLCQIPNISSVSAVAIMKNYRSLVGLIEDLKINPDCLNSVSYETGGKTRKISKSVIDGIKKYLL
jgi:hypothetical protein